ncbi:MAG TPA: polyprenyl synthetase family protein [Thermoplasmata archaeon]
MREPATRRSVEDSEGRLESLLKPYRDLSNAQIVAVWEEYAAEHPATPFPSTSTMRENARLFTAGKRYRYALALAGYRILTGERPSRGLERAATWVEWYHLYTLFLDDIMDEDVRRRTVPSAWATNAKLYRGADGNRPAVVFRTRRHRYGASQAILDALRLRSLGERAIEGAVDLPPAVRLELLSELTSVDLVLSDGQGLDIDFERIGRIPEADYVRMSEAKTARLYLGAAATAAVAARASSEDRAALESFARHFAVAFQDRDDLLGAGVVASRIGGSSEGDIRQGKRTRLYVLAMQMLRPVDRAAFSRAYGRGPRTTRRDVATVRAFLRADVLEEAEERIAEHIAAAKRDLDRLPSKDPEARALLQALLEAQRSRVR